MGPTGTSALVAIPQQPSPWKRASVLKVGSAVALVLSLSLFGTAFVLRHGTTRATTQWPVDSTINIYMATDATAAQVAAMSNSLHADRDVKSMTFCDQACSYAVFKQMFANTPGFPPTPTSSNLPSYFRVLPAKPSLANEIDGAARNKPGVSYVVGPSDALMHRAVRVGYRATPFITALGVVALTLAFTFAARSLRLRT